MRFLLDVNVLIALLDPDHVHHERAFRWFEQTGKSSWATCPIVQNGAIRILGAKSYVTLPMSTVEVAELVAEWTSDPAHQFWADSFPLADDPLVDRNQLTSPLRLTDIYLLALAVKNGGQLATLDRRIPVTAVAGGAEAIHLID